MKASINAGDYDRRITIKRPTEGAADAFNVKAITYPVYATLWASKKDISDGEKFSSAEMRATISTRFRVRWSEKARAILPTDILIHGGREYGIVGLKEMDERRREIEISTMARAENRLPSS